MPAPSTKGGNTRRHRRAPRHKVKIRTDLNPETLTNNATPVEFRISTKEFKVFFWISNLGKRDRIEQQQALIKLINSVLAAKLRGKIDDDTPVITKINVAQNMAGEAVPLDARPQGTSCFAILESHFQISNPLFKRRSKLLKLKSSQREHFTSYITRLKEPSEQCDLHNVSHKDVILLIATMHRNKEELRKDIGRYRNPTWLAVKQLAENYKRSMVNEEPHKVGPVKQQPNKKKSRFPVIHTPTNNNSRVNAFVVEARDTNPTNSNWTGQANAQHVAILVTYLKYTSACPTKTQ